MASLEVDDFLEPRPQWLLCYATSRDDWFGQSSHAQTSCHGRCRVETSSPCDKSVELSASSATPDRVRFVMKQPQYNRRAQGAVHDLTCDHHFRNV